MSVFKSFLMYDFNREYFLILIRRGFEVTKKWADIRLNLEKKLHEDIKKHEENLLMESDQGNFLCSFEKQTSIENIQLECYFILLAFAKVEKEEHKATLRAMKERITKVEKYSKLNRQEIDSRFTKDLTEMMEEAEKQYISKYGIPEIPMTKPSNQQKKYRKELAFEIKKITVGEKSGVPDKIQNILILGNSPRKGDRKSAINIRGFMMFDYTRQYFFMTINKILPVDQEWLDDRNLLEKHIQEQHKNPPEVFEFKTENACYRAKYHKEQKCYLILYVQTSVPQERTQHLLEQIFQFVTLTQNYIKLRKDDIEKNCLGQIESIIQHTQINNCDAIEQQQIITRQLNSPQPLQYTHSPQYDESNILLKQTCSKINPPNTKNINQEETQQLVQNN